MPLTTSVSVHITERKLKKTLRKSNRIEPGVLRSDGISFQNKHKGMILNVK